MCRESPFINSAWCVSVESVPYKNKIQEETGWLGLLLSALRKVELRDLVKHLLCLTNELHCPLRLVGTGQSLLPHLSLSVLFHRVVRNRASSGYTGSVFAIHPDIKSKQDICQSCYLSFWQQTSVGKAPRLHSAPCSQSLCSTVQQSLYLHLLDMTFLTLSQPSLLSGKKNAPIPSPCYGSSIKWTTIIYMQPRVDYRSACEVVQYSPAYDNSNAI